MRCTCRPTTPTSTGSSTPSGRTPTRRSGSRPCRSVWRSRTSRSSFAKKNEDMYSFSPYDVERVYGMALLDISITEKYYEMVDDARIRKTKIKAREFFETLAELSSSRATRTSCTRTTVKRSTDRGQDHRQHLRPEDPAAGRHAVAVQRGPDLRQGGQGHRATSARCKIAKAMDRWDFAQTIEVSIRALYRGQRSDPHLVGAVDRGGQQ